MCLSCSNSGLSAVRGGSGVRCKLQTGKKSEDKDELPSFGLLSTRQLYLRAPFRLIRKSQLRHFDPPASAFTQEADSRLFDAHLTQGRPPCNARVTDELRMQRTALPHFLCRPMLCPTPICHGTTSCSCTPQRRQQRTIISTAALHDFHLDGCRWPRS